MFQGLLQRRELILEYQELFSETLYLQVGGITDEIYDKKLKEYKERQAKILTEMRIHSDADEDFYLTANIVLNVAKRAYDIVKSSEPEEKRQFLGYLLQNSKLERQNLVFELKTPFNTIYSTRLKTAKLRG